VRHSRNIPCAIIQRLETSDLPESFRGGLDKRHSTVLRLNQKHIQPKQHVPEAVSPALPATFSACRVDAGEYPIVKTIDVVSKGDSFVELKLEAPRRWPDFCRPTACQSSRIKQHTTRVIATAEKYGIVETDRLRDVDLVLIGPWVVPERLARVGIMRFEAIAMKNQQLSLSVNHFDSGGRVARLVAADAPNGFPRTLIIRRQRAASITPGIDNDQVFMEQRGTRHAPFNHGAARITADLTLPKKFASRWLKRIQNARCTKCVNGR
jgi:hypothetical protein